MNKISSYQTTVETIFSSADIRFNGSRPWDIGVKDERFYKRFLRDGSLGLGESFMDGWWDCAQLDEMFCRLFRSMTYQKRFAKSFGFYLSVAQARLFPQGGKARSHRIGQLHYDIGNDLYARMLDKRMVYSCGYWPDANNLDEAQEAKLELVCRKLKLEPGMHLLDVGCGWGSLALYAAEKYRVKVTGITVSKAQLALAKERCRGLPVDLRFQDYRDLNETFDRIASIGMFEHVGLKYHRCFMEKMRHSLKPDGLFLLHTIGSGRPRRPDPWLEKYIFPGCHPPALSEIATATEGLFAIEDTHNFGADYDKTVLAWCANFERSWDAVKANYDERFYRMWRYYLLSGAAAFRSRYSHLYQIVLAKTGVPGGYTLEGNYQVERNKPDAAQFASVERRSEAVLASSARGPGLPVEVMTTD